MLQNKCLFQFSFSQLEYQEFIFILVTISQSAGGKWNAVVFQMAGACLEVFSRLHKKAVT